jgi:hypothetical protein
MGECRASFFHTRLVPLFKSFGIKILSACIRKVLFETDTEVNGFQNEFRARITPSGHQPEF